MGWYAVNRDADSIQHGENTSVLGIIGVADSRRGDERVRIADSLETIVGVVFVKRHLPFSFVWIFAGWCSRTCKWTLELSTYRFAVRRP